MSAPELPTYLLELFGPATPGKTTSQVYAERFSDEESRLLKAHISGNLTKYINNLKLDPSDSEPFMYSFMQGIIGVTTLYFYYCAVPAIIYYVVSRITLGEFHVLLFDPIFRSRWLHGIPVTHEYNTRKTPHASSSATVDDSFYTTGVDLYIFEKSVDPSINHLSFYDHFIANVPKATLRIEAQARTISSVFERFQRRMAEINTFVSTRTLSQCLNDSAKFIECIEDLRTIYLFYFKGGNSIRQIMTSTNNYLDPSISIKNINDIIPYGSDFDTNILVNPFLSTVHFNNLCTIFNIFIPQISQYISIPTQFRDALLKPADDATKLVGISDEQELQMNNLVSGYSELNVHYLGNQSKKRDKAIADFGKEKPRKFFVSPQKTLATGLVCTKMTQKDISGNLVSETFSSFPTLVHDASDSIIKKHMIKGPLNDYCLGCLQYSINISIPKFQLNRYFLKFKLGEQISKTNLKYRLFDVDGTFNAEMLDISIVNPQYTINTDNTTYSCELLELWLSSTDCYKILIDDKYKLLDTMKSKLPSFGTDAITNLRFPVFVNSINMQINDLTLTMEDTLREKKYEKLKKRLNRLLTLHYVKAVSPFYEKDPIVDMLYYDNIANLATPIPSEFFTIIGITEDSVKDETKLKHIRGLFEYYTAQFESNFYKDLMERGFNLFDLEYRPGSATTKLHDFVGQLMGHYLTTVILKSSLASKKTSDTVYGFHSFLLNLFDISSQNIGNEFIRFAFKTPSDTDQSLFIQRTGVVSKNIGDSSCTLKYNTLNFEVHRDYQADSLSILLDNKDNNYRIPSFFVACLTWSMYKGAIQIDKTKLHDSMKLFLDFALQNVTFTPMPFAPSYGPFMQKPVILEAGNKLDPVDMASTKFQIIQTLAFISEKIQQKVNLTPGAWSFDLVTEAPDLYYMLVNCFTRLSYYDTEIDSVIKTTIGNIDYTAIIKKLYNIVKTDPTGLQTFCDAKFHKTAKPKNSYTIYPRYVDPDTVYMTFHYNPFLSLVLKNDMYLQHRDSINSIEDYTNDTIVYIPTTNKLFILDSEKDDVFLFKELEIGSELTVENTSTGNIIYIKENTSMIAGFVSGGAAGGKLRKSRRYKTRKSNRKTRKSRRL